MSETLDSHALEKLHSKTTGNLHHQISLKFTSLQDCFGDTLVLISALGFPL
jgi:hypothetical protein